MRQFHLEEETLPFHVWQRSVVDDTGNVMSNADVEVRDQVTSSLVQLYSDYDGAFPLGNPITADADGFVRFYVATGRYRIEASSGALTRVWENELLGLPSTHIEYARSTAEVSAGVTPDYKQYADLPVIDIRRHGYRADDSTDNVAAFDEANDVADELGGAIIQLPPGIGRIASEIIITAPRTWIRGCGWKATALRATTTTDMMELRGDGDRVSGIAFWGAATDATPAQMGISTNSSFAPQYVRIDGCFFGGESPPGTGARLNNCLLIDSGCDFATIDGNVFDTPWGATLKGYGVLCGETKATTVTRNRFYFATNKGRHSIYFSVGCTYCIATHNYSEHATHEHITFNALTAVPSLHNLIAFNHLVGGNPSNASTGAISIWGASRGTIIHGNVIDTPGQKGIVVMARGEGDVDMSSTDNVVSDNYILNAGLQGIDVVGSTNTVVRGNFVRDSSQISANASAQIRLVATASGGQAVTKCTVSDNVCIGTGVNSGIELNTTSPIPTGTVLRGNRLDAGSAGQVNASTVTYDGAKGTTTLIASGSTSVVVTHRLGITPTADQITVTITANPTSDPGNIWVDTITSTQFTINCRNNPGVSNLDLAWHYHPSH